MCVLKRQIRVFYKRQICRHLERMAAQKPRIRPLLCLRSRMLPLHHLCLVYLQNANVCLQKNKCVK